MEKVKIFNNTDKRRWWKYEDLQSKQKSKAHRLVTHRNYADKFLDLSLLLFTKIYLLIRRVIMYLLTPITVLILSFWVSGFLAAQRESFWSLLAIVVGVVGSLILANIMEKK